MYDAWKNALAIIEQQVSPANFSTWFQDTSLITTDEGIIKIGVKNSFYVKQLRNRYYDIIKSALESNNITVATIDFAGAEFRLGTALNFEIKSEAKRS